MQHQPSQELEWQEQPEQGNELDDQRQQQQQQQQLPPRHVLHNASSSCSWPLLTLPDLAMEAVLEHLPRAGRQSLRLVCKGTQARVEACTKQLAIFFHQLPAPSTLNRAPLAQRYSSLQRLDFREADIATIPWGVSHAAVLGLAGVRWSSVTSLRFHEVTAPTAAALLPAFCSLKECMFSHRVGTTACSTVADEQCMPAELLAALASLPSLASLHFSDNVATDASVPAIACCTALTFLKLPFDDISDSSWASLAALPLRALHLEHFASSGSPQQVLLSGLSALTSLEVLFEDPADAYSATLHLPTSLITLVTHATPTFVSPLPHLTQLQQLNAGEDPHFMTAQQLVQLASHCPALRILVVSGLDWQGAAWPSSPLLALTNLQCMDEINDEGSGLQLAQLCPNLRSLDLRCGCWFVNDSSVFLGLSALEWLNIAAEVPANRQDRWHGLMDASAGVMSALASMPALQHLRVNAAVEVMPRLSSLTALKSLSISFESPAVHDDDNHWAAGLAASMAPPCLPPQLRVLKVCFEGNDSHSSFGFEGVPAAVMLWLLHAPQLASLSWGVYHQPTCCSMTDVWLWAAAANPTIAHIHVSGQHRITPSLLARVNLVHAARGLVVVVDKP